MAPLRHGTRFPSSQAMGPMRNLLPKIQQQVVGNHLAGRGHLCPEDLARIKGWRFRVAPQEDKRLTKSGEEEMLGLGRRWALRVPGLRAGNHSWIYTDTQVCGDSYLYSHPVRGPGRVPGGLRRAWAAPPPCHHQSRIGNYWHFTTFVKNTKRQFFR